MKNTNFLSIESIFNMTTINKDIIDRLFFCEKLKVKLLPEGCAKRQIYAKDPPRMNPLSSSCSKIDYSKCLNCSQGSIYSNLEIAIPEIKEKFKKYAGKKIKPHLCRKCGEIDPSKFEKAVKSLCMSCRAINRLELRKTKRGNADGKEII